jgi:hypothetical protein
MAAMASMTSSSFSEALSPDEATPAARNSAANVDPMTRVRRDVAVFMARKLRKPPASLH